MATEKNRKNLIKLAECAVMLALSIVLSFITIFKMPMGGEITLLSMLPICLISVKYGCGAGLSTAALYSVFQLIQGIASGNVFVYTKTIPAIIVCVLFDYLVPFTVLGLAGAFRKRGRTAIIAGIALVILVRFLCHYATGVYIWGQWAPEGMSKYLYSLVYNGQYMLPECVMTSAAAAILINIKQIQKLLGLSFGSSGKKEPENGFPEE